MSLFIVTIDVLELNTAAAPTLVVDEVERTETVDVDDAGEGGC